MIRKSVEKIRGMVFTPEELYEIVLPAVEESNSKLFHKESETRRLVKDCRSQYSVWANMHQKGFMLYNALYRMIDVDPERIVSLWDKVLEERELKFPEDISKDVYLSFQRGNLFVVYNDTYVVDMKHSNTVYFKMKEE